MEQTTKHVFDAAAGGTIIATLIGWAPSIAAVLAIIWTLMRMYETYLAIRRERRDAERDRNDR